MSRGYISRSAGTPNCWTKPAQARMPMATSEAARALRLGMGLGEQSVFVGRKSGEAPHARLDVIERRIRFGPHHLLGEAGARVERLLEAMGQLLDRGGP